MTSSSTILLERKQLLGPESLIMDLTGRLDQILKMRPCQKVPQADEFAVRLVLDVDDSPSVLTASNALASYYDVFLGSDNGKGNQIFDRGVHGSFFVVVFFVVIGEHAQVVEGEFFPDALFEGRSFFQGERVGFGYDRDDVDNIGEFLEDYNIDWFEAAIC